MWGLKSHQNRSLANIIFNLILDRNISAKYNYNLNSPKQGDQQFLNQYVYPLIRHTSLIHDSFLCNHYKDSRPFPTKRNGDCFIGNPFKCSTNETFIKCPLQCRPINHTDWEYC
jgi:hypothetical protein